MLTKQIKLDPISQKKYERSRAILFATFAAGSIFVAGKILFPSQSLDLFFENINAAKNTIVNPRLSNGKVPPKGVVKKDDSFYFNANPLGNFSSININIKADNKQNWENSSVSIQKSYQSFFYPIGSPLGFKNGSLLTTEDGNYYIVSANSLRRFASTNVILDFGFPKNSFQLISNDDLKYNQVGPDISSSATYPDDTLFAVDEKFYQLKNGKLLAFVSSRAFLSQYQATAAITKNKDIFNQYPLSENPLGFADATLASAGGSAFILSQGKSFPIADFNTFQEMGFSWDNVVALESDELGAYEQQKQFTLSQPHPNGTLFVDKKENKYFIIENGQKQPILSSAILETYPVQNAIEVDEEGSLKKLSCHLEKNLFPANTYSCKIALTEISDVLGNDYQLEAKFSSDAKIKEVNLDFSTPLSFSNLMTSLSKIKGNLKNNYTK